MAQPHSQDPFALPPIGPGDLTPACRELCRALDQAGVAPSIQRLGTDLLERFAQECWAGHAYINCEQDLGLEGLLAGKES